MNYQGDHREREVMILQASRVAIGAQMHVGVGFCREKLDGMKRTVSELV